MENVYTYELVVSDMGVQVIKRTDADGNQTWIPVNESNSDYQAYLVSLEPVKTTKSK